MQTTTLDPYDSAVDQAAAVRAGEVSPVELVDAHLARIDDLDPILGAFCHRADDKVRAAATAAPAPSSPGTEPSSHRSTACRSR